MSIGARGVRLIALQKIDDTPHAQASAQAGVHVVNFPVRMERAIVHREISSSAA